MGYQAEKRQKNTFALNRRNTFFRCATIRNFQHKSRKVSEEESIFPTGNLSLSAWLAIKFIPNW